jgi:putative protease
MSENACLKKLEATKGEKLPCSLTVTLAGDAMRVAATAGGADLALEFPLGSCEPARTANMEGVLRAQFERCGDAPFRLAAFAAPGFPPVVIPPARLKDIRREIYGVLAEKVTRGLRQERDAAKKRALSALAGRRSSVRPQRAELIVRLDHVRDCHLLHQEGIDAISLPVSRANMHQIAQFVRKIRGLDRVSWRLPFIIFEADLPFYREAVAWLASQGFHRFEAANLSHFPLLKDLEKQLARQVDRGRTGAGPASSGRGASAAPLEIATDYRLFSMNSQALLAWQDLGATAATLYIEDDAENMAELLALDLPILRRVLIYGIVPVITSKIKIRDVKSDAPVVSDRGDGYTVAVKDGLSVISSTKPFSLTGYRRRLQEMGCVSFVADLSQLSREEWPRVLDAFAKGAAIPETTEFNFTMGLV